MTELLFLIGAALMVWIGFRMVKGNPESFSKDAMGRSFYVLGILTLILMGVIAVCVKLLK
mgnify:CR=1 FL=1